jgi:hypothetical protein
MCGTVIAYVVVNPPTIPLPSRRSLELIGGGINTKPRNTVLLFKLGQTKKRQTYVAKDGVLTRKSNLNFNYPRSPYHTW